MKMLRSICEWLRSGLSARDKSPSGARADAYGTPSTASTVPSYGNIELGTNDPAISSGAGFTLNKPSDCDFTYSTARAQTLLRKGSPVLIVRSVTAFQNLDLAYRGTAFP
jgi:hypothetical protein